MVIDKIHCLESGLVFYSFSVYLKFALGGEDQDESVHE